MEENHNDAYVRADNVSNFLGRILYLYLILFNKCINNFKEMLRGLIDGYVPL